MQIRLDRFDESVSSRFGLYVVLGFEKIIIWCPVEFDMDFVPRYILESVHLVFENLKQY